MMKRVFILSFNLSLCFFVHAQEVIIASITVEGNQLPLDKTLIVSEPGLILVELDEDSKNNNVEVEIQPFLSGQRTINQARVDFSGEMVLHFRLRYSGSYDRTVRATVKHLPVIDLFEPNDNFDQAARVGFFTWYQSMLFPYGDIDYFKVVLDKPFWIYPETQESHNRVEWDLYDDANTFLTDAFPFYAKKGSYTFKLSPRYNESSTEPIFFMLGLYSEYDELEPNDTIHQFIEVGMPYRVNFSSENDVDLIALKTKDKGYAIFQTLNISNDRVSFYYGEHHGNPLVVPVMENDTVRVRMVPNRTWSNSPFLVSSQVKKEMDLNEPNDSIHMATKLEVNQELYFSLFLSGDEDWFEVTTTGETIMTVNIFDELWPSGSNAIGPDDLVLELYNAEHKFKYSLPSKPSNFGVMYTSGIIQEPGKWYIRALPNGMGSKERLLTIEIFGTNIKGTRRSNSLDDVYFVGFELDSSAHLSIKSLVETTNTPYVLVDSTGSLGMTMSKVFEEAKKDRGSLTWLIVLLVLAGLGVGYWFLQKGN